MVPRDQFEAELKRAESWQDQPPAEVLLHGSGWGMLEALRRESAHESPFAGAGLDFSGSLGREQAAWIDLLQTGKFPDTDSLAPVAGHLAQPDWHVLLENAVQHETNANWEAWLHLGNMRLHSGDAEGARQAWEKSLARKRTPWALRNLAVLARQQGRLDEAANLYHDAYGLQPDLVPLLIETARALIDAGRSADFLSLLATANNTSRNHGRVHLLEVEAGLAVGDLERVGHLLNEGFEIVDYREGDEILTELWVRYHVKRLSRDENIPADEALVRRVQREFPIPALFDFRMIVPETDG